MNSTKSMKVFRKIFFSIVALGLYSTVDAGQSETDHTTYMRYNINGKLTGVIQSDPDGAGPLKYLATRNTYSANGQLVKTEEGELQNWQDENVKPSNWFGFTAYSTTQFTYNSRGLNDSVALKNQQNEMLQFSQKSYDSYDRVECEVIRMNPTTFGNVSTPACTATNSSQYGYDRVTKYVYDDYNNTSFGKLQVVYKAYGTPLQQAYQTYTYHSERPGLIETITDANQNTTRLEYDGYAKLSHRYYEDGTYNFYDYDANFNIVTEHKRNGAVFTYTYDNLNRKKTKRPAGKPQTVYDYDLAGLMLSATKNYSINYRPVKDSVINTYDALGNVLTSEIEMDGTNRKIINTYDLNGNRQSITHPDGQTFTYEFDNIDRVIGVKNQAAQSLLTVAYNNKGQRKSLARNGSVGAKTIYGFDSLGRLESLQHNLANIAHDSTLGMTYNPANQVTSVSFSNQLFRYSEGQQMQGNYYVNSLNQYTSISGASLDYDTNGNLTTDGVNSIGFTYDDENRLMSSSGSSKNATFVYDTMGRLYEASINGSATQFLYDGDAMIAEFDENGNLIKRYVHGDKVDEPWMQFVGSDTSVNNANFMHANHQGSIIAISDKLGTSLQTLNYDAYGIPASNNDSRFGYTGQIYFKPLQLNYYKARIYHPKLGRFLQTDPVFYDDQMNLYAYAYNDPVNVTDPTGEFGLTLLAAAGRIAISCAKSKVCRGKVKSVISAVASVITANEVWSTAKKAGAKNEISRRKRAKADDTLVCHMQGVCSANEATRDAEEAEDARNDAIGGIGDLGQALIQKGNSLPADVHTIIEGVNKAVNTDSDSSSTQESDSASQEPPKPMVCDPQLSGKIRHC